MAEAPRGAIITAELAINDADVLHSKGRKEGRKVSRQAGRQVGRQAGRQAAGRQEFSEIENSQHLD